MGDFILMKNKSDIFWYILLSLSSKLCLFKLRNVYVKVYGPFTFTALLAIFSGEYSHFYCFESIVLWVHERLDSRKETNLGNVPLGTRNHARFDSIRELRREARYGKFRELLTSFPLLSAAGRSLFRVYSQHCIPLLWRSARNSVR